MSPKKALERAISIAGGVGALARRLDITAQAVSQWQRVPVAQVLKVEHATNISRYELRPDIYPRAEPERVAS